MKFKYSIHQPYIDQERNKLTQERNKLTYNNLFSYICTEIFSKFFNNIPLQWENVIAKINRGGMQMAHLIEIKIH